MYFNLKIIAAKDELNFRQNSGLVKFFIDSDKTEKLLDEFFLFLSFQLGKTQRKNFLDKKADELVYYSQTDEPSLIFIKKVKLDKTFTNDFFRNYFAGLIPSLKKKNINSLHLIVPSFFDYKDYYENEFHFMQSMIEGMHLGNYTFDKYISEKDKPVDLSVYVHYTDL